MRVYLSGRKWGGLTQSEVREAIEDKYPNVTFIKSGKSDLIIIPDDAEEASMSALKTGGEVRHLSAFLKSKKKMSVERKPSSKKNSVRKQEKTSRQKPTVRKPSAKKSSHKEKKSDRSGKEKKSDRSGKEKFQDRWESQFTVRKGEPWRIYLFEILPKNKWEWGLYGPSKEDFMRHMEFGASQKHQDITFVDDPDKANLVVVGDYSDNETRKVAKSRFSSFVISSVLALKLLTRDQADEITAGYQDRLKQQHAVTYDRRGVHYH
jgi:hypothetical protein